MDEKNLRKIKLKIKELYADFDDIDMVYRANITQMKYLDKVRK